jgi:hypothetical protein
MAKQDEVNRGVGGSVEAKTALRRWLDTVTVDAVG